MNAVRRKIAQADIDAVFLQLSLSLNLLGKHTSLFNASFDQKKEGNFDAIKFKNFTFSGTVTDRQRVQHDANTP